MTMTPMDVSASGSTDQVSSTSLLLTRICSKSSRFKAIGMLFVLLLVWLLCFKLVRPPESHVNIAFLGDSISRYQYLSLVYYLHHNAWIDPKSRPSFVIEGQFKTWNSFYKDTNNALSPYEKCDCYRPQKWNTSQIFENRYYHNPLTNVHVVYIQAFGGIPSHGHWNASSIPENEVLPTAPLPSVWTFDFQETISLHLALLNPKPDWVVFNAGVWANTFHKKRTRNAVVRALDIAGIRGIWLGTDKRFND